MYEISHGKKYNKDMRGAQISAAIRRDIKDAIAVGELPVAKYSVTLETFSGGKSITIRVSKLDLALFDRRFLRHEIETNGDVHYGGTRRYSAELLALLDKLKTIGNAYNFDGSDIQSDYFYVNFYLHIGVDWEFEAERKEVELEAVRAEMMDEENAANAANAARSRKRWDDMEREPSPEDSPIMHSMRRRQAAGRPRLGLPRATATDGNEEALDVVPLVLSATAAIVAHVAIDWWSRRRRVMR